MKVRTKTVEIFGESFVIAPLTVAQVETYTEDDGTVKLGKFARAWYGMMCDSLNRAAGFGRADWKPEHLREEYDLEILRDLAASVMEFSGLKFVKVEAPAAAPEGEAPKPGEPPAAPPVLM